MINFNLEMRTRVKFGGGVITRVGEEASKYGNKVLFLYGKESLKKRGYYNVIIESFKKSGIEWIEHPGVTPNPKLSHAFEGVTLAQKFGAEIIVAVGGGSVIDEAKAIAAGIDFHSEDSLWSLYKREIKSSKVLPIIAVMTMPATASEMNDTSVLTNDMTKEKFSISNVKYLPQVAIMDPEITVSIPLDQTAYAGTDIISHASEGYFCNDDTFSPVQEEYALAICKATKRCMDVLMKKPEDIQARSSLMWVATLAWNGIGTAGWGNAGTPCHTLEHPISGVYEIPHGAGLSIVTPAYLKLRVKSIPEKIIKFGKVLFNIEGALTAKNVISLLEDWYQEIGTPTRFSNCKGISHLDLDLLVAEAEKLNNIWNSSDFVEGEIRKAFELMV